MCPPRYLTPAVQVGKSELWFIHIIKHNTTLKMKTFFRYRYETISSIHWVTTFFKFVKIWVDKKKVVESCVCFFVFMWRNTVSYREQWRWERFINGRLHVCFIFLILNMCIYSLSKNKYLFTPATLAKLKRQIIQVRARMWSKENSHPVLTGVDMDTPISENCLVFYVKLNRWIPYDPSITLSDS